MYPNPLNPRFRASNHRRVQETSQPSSSSQPQTSLERTTAQRLLRHKRRVEEWVKVIGVEEAEIAAAIAARVQRIYWNPDTERIEKFAFVDTLRECTGEDPNTHQKCVWREFNVCDSLSERIDNLKLIFDARIVARSFSTLDRVMVMRASVEDVLRKCEEALVPLASPTWIDSHSEDGTVEKAVDGTDNSRDGKMGNKTKGRMNKETDETDGKTDGKTGDTTEFETDGTGEAEDKKGKQSGGKKKRKKKNKKRKR